MTTAAYRRLALEARQAAARRGARRGSAPGEDAGQSSPQRAYAFGEVGRGVFSLPFVFEADRNLFR